MLITYAVTVEFPPNFLDWEDPDEQQFYKNVLSDHFALVSSYIGDDWGEVVKIEELKNYGTMEKI